MKKITTIALTLTASVSMAQQPKLILPKTLTITLSDKQFLRLGIAINFASSTLDRQSQTNWLTAAF